MQTVRNSVFSYKLHRFLKNSNNNFGVKIHGNTYKFGKPLITIIHDECFASMRRNKQTKKT